jgi:DNA polymerase-3 subunit epsilon
MTNLDLSLEQVRFVVVDVESTGGTKGEHKLIEVGMAVIEQGAVVRRYSSLVNPHENIPDFISTMTGITDAMVAEAPEEDEALRGIEEELQHEHAVFVGHNVGFDWGFVSKAIARHGGIVPDLVRLCTCKLSRRIHQDLARHDLASVATFCNVEISGRHRALGDAEATAEVLLSMMDTSRDVHEAQTLGDLVALQYAPRTTSRRETKAREELAPYLKELPDEPGVYYFYTTKRKLLYVGKARSLMRRVRTYFHDAPLHGRSVSRMIRYVKHIEWTPTGTELGAMLLESREIKTRKPSFNVMQREYLTPWFITFSTDAFPRIDVSGHVHSDAMDYYGPFRSRLVAERLRDMIRRAYQLRSCEGALVPRADYKPCFEFHLGRCPAPCAELESAADYQSRAHEATRHLGRSESGAIGLLRERMEAAAEALDFEQAALYRDGIREIERMMVHGGDTPLTVQDLDVVVVVPTVDGLRTVEVFALQAGRLRLQQTIGNRAPLEPLAQRLEEVYAAERPSRTFTELELDELRIITSWLHQHRHRGARFVVNASNAAQLETQLQRTIADAVS